MGEIIVDSGLSHMTHFGNPYIAIKIFGILTDVMPAEFWNETACWGLLFRSSTTHHEKDLSRLVHWLRKGKRNRWNAATPAKVGSQTQVRTEPIQDQPNNPVKLSSDQLTTTNL